VKQEMIVDAFGQVIALFHTQRPELTLWGKVTKLPNSKVFSVQSKQYLTHRLCKRIYLDVTLWLNVNPVIKFEI
jgi:hypothetical protein